MRRSTAYRTATPATLAAVLLVLILMLAPARVASTHTSGISTPEISENQPPAAPPQVQPAATRTRVAWLPLLISETHIAHPPAAPLNLQASDNTEKGCIKVMWTASEGAQYYRLYRHTHDDRWTATYLGQVNDTTHLDCSAAQGEVYWYWVRAVGADGMSAFSNGDSGWWDAAPKAPTNLSATDGTVIGAIRVTWTGSAGAVKYRLYRHTANNPNTANLLTETTSTTFNDNTAVYLTTYWYWAKAVNAHDQASVFSSGDSGWWNPSQ